MGILMAKKQKRQKPRNLELATVLKNDPRRLRTRVVEPEESKLQRNRSRAEAVLRNEIEEDLDREEDESFYFSKDVMEAIFDDEELVWASSSDIKRTHNMIFDTLIERIKSKLKNCSLHDDDASGLAQALDIIEDFRYEIENSKK